MRKLSGLRFQILAVLSVACVGSLLLCVRSLDDSTYVSWGEVDVKVYVVALDGVSGQGVGNITDAVEGCLQACLVNASRTLLPPFINYVFGKLEFKTNVTVVRDWNAYKEIVENESNVIIVNVHGETVPVPAGYTGNAWVDRIAEAMLTRNVTWVHTAGYPFFYSYLQESGEALWGEDGFKQLMGHIGLENVTCWPVGYEEDLIHMNTDAQYTIKEDWGDCHHAVNVERGRPLNGSDFGDRVAAAIWGVKAGCMPGGIIEFSAPNQTSSSGFYVHVGTHKTYDSNIPPEETDGDFSRSYVGTAQAIYTSSFKPVSERAFSAAEDAVFEAETEGRTKGLEEAEQLLQSARNDFDSYYYSYGVFYANQAKEAAEAAEKPTFLESYGIPLAVLGVIGGVSACGLIFSETKKNKKKR